jgi:hypothetical protein
MTPDKPPQKRSIPAVLQIALAGLVLGAGVYGMSLYYNHTARRAAVDFCAAVRPGSPAADVLARADAAGVAHLADPAHSSHIFLFRGFITDVATCYVVVAQGKVESSIAAQVIDPAASPSR